MGTPKSVCCNSTVKLCDGHEIYDADRALKLSSEKACWYICEVCEEDCHVR